jgi:serine/threonine-protein kinase HipA
VNFGNFPVVFEGLAAFFGPYRLRERVARRYQAGSTDFKLPMGLVGNLKYDLSDSVENEWLCSLILQEFGLPVAFCEPHRFEDVKVLVVERFDRRWVRESRRVELLRLSWLC